MNSDHKSPDTWTIAEAKTKLDELIDLAQSAGPQVITRNGRKPAVVVAPAEWERKAKRAGNLAEFLAASPLPGSRIKIRRMSGRSRKLDL